MNVRFAGERVQIDISKIALDLYQYTDLVFIVSALLPEVYLYV
jgi:hypothetical protein